MKLNLYCIVVLIALNLISLLLFFNLGIKGIQKMIDYIDKDMMQEFINFKNSLRQGNEININPINTLQRGLVLSQINNLEKKMNVKRNVEELALTNQENN